MKEQFSVYFNVNFNVLLNKYIVHPLVKQKDFDNALQYLLRGKTQALKNLNCFLYQQRDSTAVNFEGYFVSSNFFPCASVSEQCSKSCVLDKSGGDTWGQK